MEKVAPRAFAYTDPREFANASVFHGASVRRGRFDDLHLLYFDDRKGNRHYLQPWTPIVRERK